MNQFQHNHIADRSKSLCCNSSVAAIDDIRRASGPQVRAPSPAPEHPVPMTNRTSRKVRIEAYVTPAERDRLHALATQLHISLSDLIRRSALGTRLPNPSRHEAVRELVRINADLARLGNLLKLGIDEETLDPAAATDLIAEIRTRQVEVKARLAGLR